MFNLIELSLYGKDENQVFSYPFVAGINYFKGKNDTGKTEFYTFLDYMFGSSINLSEKDWFKGSLQSAELVFLYDNRKFAIKRFIDDPNKNFFRYFDEDESEQIRLSEYRAKLNSIFSSDQTTLRELRTFVEEDIGYRTFTLFNFFGENRQGVLNDFFDKCSRLEYSIKLPALLNYIFNKNIARINDLKKQEEELKSQLDSLEWKVSKNDDIRGRVNHQLKVLGIHKVFTGKNSNDILGEIAALQNSLEKDESSSRSQTITELEAMYTSLDEQIKKQRNLESDHKQFIEDEVKQKVLLDKLQEIVGQKAEYMYLVEPLISLVSDLDKSISFNKYLIQESTTRELKKQRDKVRQQILANKSRFEIYSVSKKTQAITLIKEYLSYYDDNLNNDNLLSIRKKLKSIREEIRMLQNENDTEKLNNLSMDITRLYKSSVDVSELAEFDFNKDGFHISYLKNGNILQPQISDTEENNATSQIKNYYTGSMARHTLIQLCGYLGFLRMLIKEGKYPLIPFLVIDHISKPFDSKNQKALGAVLHEAYRDIQKSDMQVILFDDEDASNLGIIPDLCTDLLNEEKSGFNPFYTPAKGTSEDTTN